MDVLAMVCHYCNTRFLICYLIAVFGILSCDRAPDRDKYEKNNPINQKALFTILKPEQTGLNFTNKINEDRNLNGILYEYLYNGGGVAVADFNGDGLQDIYFVANLESNRLYLNQEKLNFKDISTISKTTGRGGFPTGVTVVDINSDGRMDIYVCKSGKFSNPDDRRNELYVNQGNDSNGIPIFKEMAKSYGLDLPHFSTQAAFFDYDRDNDLDLFLINHGTKPYSDDVMPELKHKKSSLQSSRLFDNKNGFYEDVSEQSGIINNSISFGLGLAIGDLNNDGWPDILVGHDYSEKDHLYLNRKDGTFEEVIQRATTHISFFSMGNDIADLNNDGWLDFMSLDMMSDNNYDIKTSMSGMNPERFYELTKKGLHHQYMFNALQLNNGVENVEHGIPLFSDVSQMYGVSSTDWSWGPLIFDMDNDGWKDIFVSNGIKRDLRNNDFVNYKKERFDEFFGSHGQQTYVSKQRARDFTIELVQKMPRRKKPNYFFKNKTGFGFEKLNEQWVKYLKTNSNGAAFADFDNDGDLDIVVNNMGDPALFYKNNTSEFGSNNYLKLSLKGPRGNENAIGARVILENENLVQIQENHPTRGFQSASNNHIHFGLGNVNEIERLKIIWPDGRESFLSNIKANQSLEVDYNSSLDRTPNGIAKARKTFYDMTDQSKLDFLHKENEFDDFARESLLPHRMSQMGPALTVGDVNGDSLEDIFIGGAKGQSSRLYWQEPNGSFREETHSCFIHDADYEDTAALFFDADADGDEDLYVVSGGNEVGHFSDELNDRFYQNNNGVFKKVEGIPYLGLSGSCVKACDYDLDGDLDLFIGGRQKPGNYPEPVSSHILRNNSANGQIKFEDITLEVAKPLLNIGMVTDAIWIHADEDRWPDLLLVGEWMSPRLLRNQKGHFFDATEQSGLASKTGWWFSLASADFDGDGDEDVLAGNLGLNYKYKASPEEPFEIYQMDFDANGTKDIILGFHEQGSLYPLRGRECSSNQIPSIKDRYKNYHQFAQATLTDVYGRQNLEGALHYKVNTFTTSYFKNNGDGTFQIRPIGHSTQISSVNTLNIDDFDNDGNLDVVVAGNWFVSEVETPRNDASCGLFLKGNGKGEFLEIPAHESGLYIKGDTRVSDMLTLKNGKKAIVLGKNNGPVQLISYESYDFNK